MATIKSYGYTLIELVVVVGLIGLLSLGIMGVFLSSIRGSNSAQVEVDLKSQGDLAISRMERTIRGAISPPTCGSNQVSYVVDVGGVPTTKTYTFNQTARNLSADGVNLFGGSVTVTSATFDCIAGGGFGNGAVSISFTLAARGKMNQEVQQTFSTTVAIRSVQ